MCAVHSRLRGDEPGGVGLVRAVRRVRRSGRSGCEGRRRSERGVEVPLGALPVVPSAMSPSVCPVRHSGRCVRGQGERDEARRRGGRASAREHGTRRRKLWEDSTVALSRSSPRLAPSERCAAVWTRVSFSTASLALLALTTRSAQRQGRRGERHVVRETHSGRPRRQRAPQCARLTLSPSSSLYSPLRCIPAAATPPAQLCVRCSAPPAIHNVGAAYCQSVRGPLTRPVLPVLPDPLPLPPLQQPLLPQCLHRPLQSRTVRSTHRQRCRIPRIRHSTDRAASLPRHSPGKDPRRVQRRAQLAVSCFNRH